MSMADRPRMILIAGPTASGKSALALEIAERLGGTVVNADSMQVYRDLHVLTSRPPAEDAARVPHLLYGHVDGAEAYSAGRFLTDAARVIAEARAPLIFVGGTGLYFDSLTKGISTVPPVPEAIRIHWRERARAEPAESLHAELRARDPEMAARLRPSDTQRLVRALEVLDATGLSLARWQEQDGTPLIGPGEGTRIVLTPERPVLRERIARRFAQMMEEGAMDEVRALLARDLAPDLPVMKAIGVRPLAQYLLGTMDKNEAVDRAITETRQFAKRQETWFRNRLGDWHHVPPDRALEIAEKAISAVQQGSTQE